MSRDVSEGSALVSSEGSNLSDKNGSSQQLDGGGNKAPMQAGNYVPPDVLEADFMEYLAKSGVQALVRQLMMDLYYESEKPPRSVDWLRKALGNPLDINVDELIEENESLKEEVATLRIDLQRLIEENEELQDQVDNMED